MFLIEKESLQLHPLAKLNDFTATNIWVGFTDPSITEHPGWPLRNILALVAHHRKQLLDGLTILCWRDTTRDGIRNVSHSLLLQINDCTYEDSSSRKCVGWEKNERGNLGPRMVNLSSTMNPEKLAESAVDLNLKLMKWRLLPELDLQTLQQTKCLLIGAGTLGCNVARTLMVIQLDIETGD